MGPAPDPDACSVGLLVGQVRLKEDRDDKPIDGTGEIKEISCLVGDK